MRRRRRMIFPEDEALAAMNEYFADRMGTDYRIRYITGLDIAGTNYDLTFHHGVAFNDLPSPQITFVTEENAAAAVTAIINLVNGTPRGPGSLTTGAFAVPFNVLGTTFISVIATNTAPPATPYNLKLQSSFPVSVLLNTKLVESESIVTFVPTNAAVPEPTSLTIAATFSLGTVLLHRRRKTLLASSK
jgi:hypothetical protein